MFTIIDQKPNHILTDKVGSKDRLEITLESGAVFSFRLDETKSYVPRIVIDRRRCQNAEHPLTAAGVRYRQWRHSETFQIFFYVWTAEHPSRAQQPNVGGTLFVLLGGQTSGFGYTMEGGLITAIDSTTIEP